MNLIAMMIVRNEADRYLGPCLDHLLEFCDQIRVLDDGSEDDTPDMLQRDRVFVRRLPSSEFYRHEGRARQILLDHTMAGTPTHVLAIDADEFVSNTQALRSEIARRGVASWTLNMQEVWQAHPDGLAIRQDGGWKQHPVPILFAGPGPGRRNMRLWRIPDKALASGRVPYAAMRAAGKARSAHGDILHFGWACKAERDGRYQRYVEHDGGKYHNRRHLDSIMWSDEQVTLSWRAWPGNINKQAILARASRP
jgi:glycosyltransferase involved in cell wall biosynthesis